MEKNNQQNYWVRFWRPAKTLKLYMWAESAVPFIVVAANMLFGTSVTDAVNMICLCFSVYIALASVSFVPDDDVRKSVRLQLVAILLLTVINVALTVYFKISNAA